MMRIRAAQYRAGLSRIALMCIGAVLVAATAALAGTEDEVLKSAGPTAAAAGPSGTSAANPLDIQRVVMALALVLGAIFLLRWIAHCLLLKSGTLRGSKAIHVVSRSVLSPKQQVIMLRVGKRLIVVGDSGGQMNALCEISDPDEVASLIGESHKEPAEAGGAGKSFGAIFRRAEEPFTEAPDLPEETPAVGLDDGATTREQINELMGKVQMMRKQFKGA
jgi:flagellar biogenesis protein FliO